MYRVSFLLSACVSLLLVCGSVFDSAAAAPLSSPSTLHDRVLSLRFKSLSAPNPTSICSQTYGCLPEGFPVPDPSTVQFIQFPNGVTVNLQGFGTASLPTGYPVQELPSYDSSTNTVTDPVLAAILAWTLSTTANPGFSPSMWNGFSNGFGVPGGSTSFTGFGGDNNNNGGSTGSSHGGSVEGGATGIVINGNGGTGNGGGGGSASGTHVIGTGSNTHPTGTGGTGGTSTTNSNGGTTNINGGNGGTTSKNGASALAGSISLVAGLAVATVFAAFF